MATVQWIGNMYEGRGFNRATGQLFQPAITFEPAIPVIKSQGQSSRLVLNTVSSSESLAASLSVDASAALRVKTGLYHRFGQGVVQAISKR